MPRRSSRRSHRRLPRVGFAALVVGATALFVGHPATFARADTVVVAIEDYYFSPSTVAAAPGATISFENRGDVAHRVVAGDGTFDSGTLEPGDSYFFTVGEAPTTFRDAYFESMTGQIAVHVEGAAPTVPASTVPNGTPPAVITPTGAGASSADAEPDRLAVTGTGSVVLFTLAVALCAFGALARRGARTTRTVLPALVSRSGDWRPEHDHLLPADERDRRDRVRRPPAEF